MDIPRGRLVVVTGVSGSGKSALVFDTLFVESQRRFLENLSAHTRQIVGQLQRPDVDTIDGLPPAIAVEQRTRSFATRSTLATQTEIYDYLRLLFARAGQAYCPRCDRPVGQQSVESIVQRVLALEQRQKVMVLAPLVRGRKGQHRDVLHRIAQAGFVRARVDGQIVDAAEPPVLSGRLEHSIEAVVDRIVVKDGIEPRLRESIDLAVRESGGTCLISHQVDGDWVDRLFSTRFACPDCDVSFSDLELRSFSFNSPWGACAHCRGLGTEPTDAEDPVEEVSEAQECSVCGGARLAPFPAAVRVGGSRISEVCGLTVEEASAWCDQQQQLASALDGYSQEGQTVAAQTLPEIAARLKYLQQVGLAYLTLDRAARSLSGGEFQRARLARCLGSGLTGACYILDEPTVGLHPRDTLQLVAALLELRDQGNSVVVVEHDADVLAAADEIVEIGPGAGRDGGHLVGQGNQEAIAAIPESATGRSLRGELRQEPMPQVGTPGEAGWILIEGANANNLRNLSVAIPHQSLTCVTGVSGSGKSSLVIDTLAPLARDVVAGRSLSADLCETASGLDVFQRVLECDARPIGKTARANAATYSKVWTEIRKLFAMTRESRLRGFTARRFSFNAAEGHCRECRGQGLNRIRMKFMPDVFVPCPACRGARFNRQTLSVRFNGRSVAEVLEMRMDEAAEHFRNLDRIHRMLSTFCDIGLGYLGLGQPAHTLSGGEAQRVKLAAALGQTTRGNSLFILDEPTSGLHAVDVQRLLSVLRRLVAAGHTVVLIEHNTDIIRAADWVLDLGPEAGPHGGDIVTAGPPQQIAEATSHTAQALRAATVLP